MLEVSGVGMTYQPPRLPWRWLVQTASPSPVRALDDVSFRVGRGEVVGLVGPNGAGKSTLLRAIAALLVPTEGVVTLDDEPVDPGRPEQRNRVGLSFPDDRSFYWRLNGRQNLEYFASLTGLDRETGRQRVKTLMEERKLAHRDKAVFGYSSGMLAQLGVARALLHEPDLLVLDEPTRSLDPVAGIELCRQVGELASEGRAVLMASHRLDEVVAASHRVLALVGGRIRWSGTAEEIAGDAAGLGARIEELVQAEADGEAEELGL